MAIPSITGRRPSRASAEDSSAFGPIAERFRRAGELEKAVNLCRDGLQRFPEQISARVTLGWALLELGKYDEAREELEQVLRRRPDNLAAIRALAELHDRSEQTLNLPMDGPGQWPPSEEVVDQAATNLSEAVAGASDDGIEEPVLIHPPSQAAADVVGSASIHDAVIAPPELGLAMWSPMPEPERTPAPEPTFGYLLNDRTEALAAAAAAPVSDHILPEVDLAALIAEADSLEAAAEEDHNLMVEPPVMVLDAAAEEPVADLVAAPAFVVPDERTIAAYAEGSSATDVEAHADGPAVFQFQAPPVPAAEYAVVEELTAGISEPEIVVPPLADRIDEAVAAFVAPAFVPPAPIAEAISEPVQEPTGPFFALETQSIGDLESNVALDECEHTLEMAFVSTDQAALDFETMPVVAKAVEIPEEVVATMPALEAAEPPRVADVLPMVAEVSAVRSKRSPVPALERFLAQVQARRQHLMAESVA